MWLTRPEHDCRSHTAVDIRAQTLHRLKGRTKPLRERPGGFSGDDVGSPCQGTPRKVNRPCGLGCGKAQLIGPARQLSRAPSRIQLAIVWISAGASAGNCGGGIRG